MVKMRLPARSMRVLFDPSKHEMLTQCWFLCWASVVDVCPVLMYNVTGYILRRLVTLYGRSVNV